MVQLLIPSLKPCLVTDQRSLSALINVVGWLGKDPCSGEHRDQSTVSNDNGQHVNYICLSERSDERLSKPRIPRFKVFPVKFTLTTPTDFGKFWICIFMEFSRFKASIGVDSVYLPLL